MSNYKVNFTYKQYGDARRPITRKGVSYDDVVKEAKELTISSHDCYTFTIIDTVSGWCQSYSQYGKKLSEVV